MIIFALAVVVAFSFLTVGVVLYTCSRTLTQERKDHREQRINWERERERLMNRVMVKEWTTYAQMTQAMEPSMESSSQGMSDEEEIRRYEQAIGNSLGVGEEVLVDYEPELKELGLK
jgi:hypothetical protein